MSDLLPSTPDADPPEEPRVVGVDSEDAEDLLSALSSDTARAILAALHEEPDPPSGIADRVDTSLQNVQYHLRRLEDAGVVEVADTIYSEKGREMKVYGPADRALVVVASPESESDGLQTALSRLLGGVGALAIGSVVVDRLVRRGARPLGFLGAPNQSGGAPPETATEAGDASGRDGGDGGGAGGAGDGGGAGGAGDGGDAAATEAETAGPTATGDDVGITNVDGGNATATTTESAGAGSATRTATDATVTGTPSPSATPTPEAMTATTPTTTPAPTPAPTTTPTPTPAPTTTPTTTPTPTPTTTPTPTPVETVDVVTTAAGAAEPAPVVSLLGSPGTLFFLGGLTVLLAWVLLGYVRQ
jgi:DNA-binding transcriptional ArsR family regulator